MSDGHATRREFVGAGAAAAATFAIGTGAAQAADRPNVVVIVIDSLRADHAFGKRARTPNIDALGREGIRFTQTFPEAMPTVPARNSILSGRRYFPFRHWHDYPELLAHPGWSPIVDVKHTFTSQLRKAGYFTAYVTDNPFLSFSSPYNPLRHSFNRFRRRGGEVGGRDTGVSAKELRHWVPPALDDAGTRDRVRRYLSNGGYQHDETKSFAARVFKDGARRLEVARQHRPFALVVDTYEPHEPWTPPRKYLDMYGDPDYHGPEPARPYYTRLDNYLHGRDRQILPKRMQALYAAEVTMTDRWLGVFLDRLHDLRLERDTIVVLVADHGVLVGDHGWSGKISSRLYEELIHVPLIVVDPERRKANRSRSYFASTHDVGPTILSMAGLDVPERMTGVNLGAFFSGRRPPERPYAYGGYGNYHYVHTDKWKLWARNDHADVHLIDRKGDPGEHRNLARSHRKKVHELEAVVRRKAGGPLPYYR
ncbi:MAG TPA: sulfatase [Thermoleophilaceae bacterium]